MVRWRTSTVLHCAGWLNPKACLHSVVTDTAQARPERVQACWLLQTRLHLRDGKASCILRQTCSPLSALCVVTSGIGTKRGSG